MIAKVLGVIDIIVACLVFFDAPHTKFFIVMLLFLTTKGLLFGLTGDFGSWFDVGCVLIITLSWWFTVPGAAVIIVVAFLGIKGTLSLLA